MWKISRSPGCNIVLKGVTSLESGVKWTWHITEHKMVVNAVLETPVGVSRCVVRGPVDAVFLLSYTVKVKRGLGGGG